MRWSSFENSAPDQPAVCFWPDRLTWLPVADWLLSFEAQPTKSRAVKLRRASSPPDVFSWIIFLNQAAHFFLVNWLINYLNNSFRTLCIRNSWYCWISLKSMRSKSNESWVSSCVGWINKWREPRGLTGPSASAGGPSKGSRVQQITTLSITHDQRPELQVASSLSLSLSPDLKTPPDRINPPTTRFVFGA